MCYCQTQENIPIYMPLYLILLCLSPDASIPLVAKLSDFLESLSSKAPVISNKCSKEKNIEPKMSL